MSTFFLISPFPPILSLIPLGGTAFRGVSTVVMEALKYISFICLLREAINKKTLKVGNLSQQGGGGPPGSQPLNWFLKNAQNALKHVKNTKKHFFHF